MDRFESWDRDLFNEGLSAEDFRSDGPFCRDDEGWVQLANVGAILRWKREDGRQMQAQWMLRSGLTITAYVTLEERCRGMQDLVEEFQCSFIEAKDVVRERRGSRTSG